MKKYSLLIHIGLPVLMVFAMPAHAAPALAQIATLTSTETLTPTPTNTPTPTSSLTETSALAQATEAPTTTATQAASATRPLIVVDTYSASEERILPGTEFNLQVRLKNMGDSTALNLVATFTPGDFVPRKSGGVLAISELDPGEKKKIAQPLTASPDLTNKKIGALVMQVSYTDVNGAAYSETFNLSLPVIAYGSGAAATATPTPTPAASNRPQLVITAYQTDTPVLQPGFRFLLNLQVKNLGNMDAKRVSMILGGGSSSGGSTDGTPEVGGISGGSGDFGDFAPVASSNVQFLGDLEVGAQLDSNATLIVNASDEPGAYPLKITFAYSDEKGKIYNDDQVVTLLVYTVPKVEVNFYRQPDPLFASQPGLLPIQVVNLGRKDTILGNMKVSAQGAQFSNNVILVGALTVGGYYTLDTTVTPEQPGPLELLVTIDYTDDFNQLQVITRTLSVEVQEMIQPEPGPGGGGMEGGGGSIPPSAQETFVQKLWRFIKGLIGLDSSTPTPAPGEAPPGEVPPIKVPGGPIPVPAGPKG